MNTQSIQPTATGARLRSRSALGVFALVIALFTLTGTAFAGTGFVATKYSANVTGASTSKESFVLSGGHYECTGSTLSGTLSEASKKLSTSISWPGGCSAPASSTAQIKANGCQFEFAPTSASAGTAGIGPAGCGPISIQGAGGFCSYTIPSQSGLKASFSNTGSGSTARVLAHIEAENLKYKAEKYCSGEFTNGTYYANWELSAADAALNPIGLSVSTNYEVAPTTTTGVTSASKSTEATMRGSVNPNVLSTTYQFQYGLNTEYGSTIPVSPESVGSGSLPVAVSQTAGSLSPSTVYHYRLKATNSQGTTYGRDRTFETLAAGKTGAEFILPTETTLTATATNTQSFTSNVGMINCAEATGSIAAGATTSASSAALTGISYHNKGVTTCSGPLGVTAELNMNACPYEFHVGESIAAGEAKGSVFIGDCEGAENALMFNGGGLCKIRIPYRQNLAPVYYRTAGEKIEVELSMTNVTTETWGLCGTGTWTGKYTGKMLLAGNKGPVSVK